ncbi:MAG: hypothetical protein AAF465_16760 [Pseudomonadota bacterium]
MSPLTAQLLMEWRYQRRRPFVWICIAIYFAIAFGDAYQNGIAVGGFQWVNGADAVMTRSVILSLLGILAAAGIIGEAAARDRTFRTEETVLSSGASRTALGFGRFSVGWLICVAACIAFVPGMLLGSALPGIPPEKLGPTDLSHYGKAIAYFLAPNFFIVGAIVFAAGSRFRSQSAAFIAGVTLLILWLLSRMLLGQDVLRHDVFPIYSLIEPFGFTASAQYKFGWTVAQNNAQFVPFAGLLLWNRLIWMTIASLVLVLSIRGLPMQPATPKAKRQRQGWLRLPGSGVASPLVLATRWELLSLLRVPGLKLLLFLAAVSLWLAASSSITHQFSLPTTDLLVHSTDFYFDKILILVLVWSAADLIWRERSHRVDELIDTLPTRDTIRLLSKTLALFIIILAFWLLSIVVNIAYQAASGFHHYELWLHFTDSFLYKAPYYIWMAVLALTLQVVIRRRFVAIGVFLLVYVSPVMLDALGLRHPLYRYGEVSFFWYSLMDGYGHFVKPHLWMLLYWSLGAAVVWTVGWLCFTRGTDPLPRRRLAQRRLQRPSAAAMSGALVVCFVSVGILLWHKSTAQATWPPLDEDALLAQVEKHYGDDWRTRPQPRVVAIDSHIDLFPEQRQLDIRGRYTLENPHDVPIEDVLVLAQAQLDLRSVSFGPYATQIHHDETLDVRHWRLGKPMQPGERITMTFEAGSAPAPGVQFHSRSDDAPEVSPVEVIGNGTSLLNLQLMPAVGYTDRVEHKPRWKRRKYGLPLEWIAPEGEAAERQPHDTLHLGWVERVDTTITTSADQIPLHAGNIIDSEITANGRKRVRFQIDRPSRGWSAVMSGRYEVAKFDEGSVPFEIYYAPEHTYTLPQLAQAFTDAMAHFRERYGAPPFDTLRLAQQSLHFDGMGNRAGLGFATEILGWKSDIERSDGSVIRKMAAHQMGMTWFGDQIIPANLPGAKVIHAGLPYWSAGLYLLQSQDLQQSRELRRQEMGELFRKRSALIDEELPFMLEHKDSTMIRIKGMILLTYLAELVGAENIEAAMARFLDTWRYRGGPYPRADHLLAELKTSIPIDYHPQLTDMFERVTRWDTGVIQADATPIEEGRWRVRATIDVHKYYAEGLGTETEVEFNTPVYFAVATDRRFTDESVLSRTLMRPKSGTSVVEIEVDERPRYVAIDPDFLLPDTFTGDQILIIPPVSSPE